MSVYAERLSNLEQDLVQNPMNFQALKTLLILLEKGQEISSDTGKHAHAQNIIVSEFQLEQTLNDFSNGEMVKSYAMRWREILRECGIKYCLPVSQLFAGGRHTIDGVPSNCKSRLALFEKHDVIPSFCNSCYKVQILTQNVAAYFKLYPIVRSLSLDRDNRRKCMVETRSDVPFPYKGYVFCESQEEAENIKKQVQDTINEQKLSDIYCGVSHGCSEYGLKYPKFKYSPDGAHHNFERPEHWDGTEKNHYEVNPIVDSDLGYYHKDFLSLRDVMGFVCWLEYAQMIEDYSLEPSNSKSNLFFPEWFPTSVKKQSKQRIAERKQLKKRRAA